MDLVMAIAVYIFIWWIVLFAVLPFGVRTQEEAGSVVPGTPESAPAKQRMLRIFLINTVVASVVFAIVYVVITYGLITPDMIPYP
jgi:predicted secreted protein